MSQERTWYSVLSTKYLIDSAAFAAILLPHLVAASPPKLNSLFPAGAQRGQTLVVTASGDFSTWPVDAWVDRPGIIATAEKEKGKLKIEVAADAIPGPYWLRLHNADGASVLRPLIVGTLPEAAETEPNDAPDKPQTVEPRVVVNGQLGKSGDVDGYRVELKQGQTLVASLQANSILGSPMDAVLQVCELVRRLPGTDEAYVVGQNHDAIGLDPQVVFTAPRDGAFLVRLFAFPATPDSSVRFAGGDDYIYRLTLTTGPFIDHALPLAVPREESQVLLGGWNLGGGPTAIVQPLSAESDSLILADSPIARIWRADAAGCLLVPRTELPNFVEPGEIPVPAVVSGRLEAPGEVDSYLFSASKDQKLRIRVAAKALGFPTDAAVMVQDDSGKSLAEADDTGRDDRDPQLDFTPPADGRYRLLIRDLARRGDLRMVYRLSIEPIEPDYSLTLAADSFVLEKDKPLEITVNVSIRDGLREPIEIHAIGLPAGVTAQPVKFEPTGDSPMADAGGGRRGRRGGNTPPSGPSVKLILKTDGATLQPGGASIRIEGRTTGSSPLVRTARFPLNLPLAGQHHAPWLTVRK
jgi:Bacterial pre-peptidase C-terminal domain